MDDLISRQAAISAICNACGKIDCDKMDKCEKLQLPPVNNSEIPNSSDTISRAKAIDALKRISFSHWFECGEYLSEDTREIEIINSKKALEVIEAISSAQPERTCVNCGRTANNGGWYADGRTRCPIEEHYALPKDGYCHLWEKRKDWEDDYVKRAEECEK